jgi:hypothetical protein
MVETKKVKWELKKDYDSLSDRYVEELLPKIIEKLGTCIEIEKWENVPQSDDEDIPF